MITFLTEIEIMPEVTLVWHNLVLVLVFVSEYYYLKKKRRHKNLRNNGSRVKSTHNHTIHFDVFQLFL